MRNKIIFYQGDPGGCGVLRVAQPAKYLQKLGYDVNVTALETRNRIDPSTAVCVFQRDYIQENIVEYWKFLKTQGIKIVYDLDDDIFSIPKNHPDYTYYQDPEVRSRFEFYLRNADVVTVSTPFLKKRLGNLNKNIEVLPNCIDFETWPRRTESIHKDVRIGWAGSPTHHYDLMLIFPALKAMMKKYNNVHLYFFGYAPPEFLTEFKDKIIYIHPGHYGFYQLKLSQLCFDIGIISVEDNNLNRSKSNVKFLEYAALQIPTLATNFGAYADIIVDGETGLLAKTTQEWEKKLRYLIDHKGIREKIGKSAFDFCYQNYGMHNYVYQWENVYKGLLSGNLVKIRQETPTAETLNQETGSEVAIIEQRVDTELEEAQLFHDQYNLSKLFTRQKRILLTDADSLFGLSLLEKSNPRSVEVVCPDKEQYQSFKTQYSTKDISGIIYDFNNNNVLFPINDPFDIILSFNTYTKLKDKGKFLGQLQKVLKRFGTLIISAKLPNEEKSQFIKNVKYFYKVNDVITLQEILRPSSEKFTVIFASKY